MEGTPKFLLALCLAIAVVSCQEGDEIANKDSNRELPEDAEVVLLRPGEEYFYEFESIPVEGGFSIGQGPHFAEVSEFTFRDGRFGYLYKPRANFIGNDWVELEMCVSIAGPECDNVPFITLAFVVGRSLE